MNEACWEGYKQVGMKKKGNRTVPICSGWCWAYNDS
jgi:hypothetical protein